MTRERTTEGDYVAPQNDLGLEIAKGDVKGHSVVHKFGAAQGLTSSSWQMVASAKDYPTPTTATALEIVSDDNTNDIAAGSGARKVTIQGIQDWDVGEVSSEVSLNGTTAVAAGSWLRVYRLKVTESGTYASTSGSSHDSTITLRVASAGATWATINTETNFGLGQSEIGAYSVPSGYSAYIKDFEIEVESTKAADVAFFARENANETSAPFTGVLQVKEVFRSLSGDLNESYFAPLGPFTGPCDFGWLAKSTSGTADVSVDFEIIIVEDA